MSLTLHQGDCLEVLRTLPDCSVDSVVTDPPYGLSFMGKRWDYDVPSVDVWRECLRVLKPGGHLLAFAGTRTQHRMACRIEDAGFEIRDLIAWVYGSGFPKSLDVSKAIDKGEGAEREVVGVSARHGGGAKVFENQGGTGFATNGQPNITAPATDAARQWSGWGTALKPALEPITFARKPLNGTVAENVLQHGTGAINVEECRVPIDAEADASQLRAMNRNKRETDDGWGMSKVSGDMPSVVRMEGRWPANFIHDGSGEVVQLFPNEAGACAPASGPTLTGRTEATAAFGGRPGTDRAPAFHADTGSAARFFYCAKASKRDRDHGSGIRNHHPTVKPTALMAYLCRLVTPPGGTVLDPFMGSGSTGRGAIVEGFGFIGIEREADYLEIARARIESARHWTPDPVERPEPEPEGQLSFL